MILARGIFETFDALDSQSREINGIDIFFFIALNERIHVYDSMRHLDFVRLCFIPSRLKSRLFVIFGIKKKKKRRYFSRIINMR